MANSWLRLWHDMPNDPKWRTIARASKQTIPAVISVYVHVLVNASTNANERGRTHGLECEDIASALDMDVEHVSAILDAMQGRVLEGDKVTGWEKRQPLREDGSSQRSKEWRERKRTQTNAEKRPDKDTDKEEEKKNPHAPDGAFNRFWDAYPKKRSRDDALKAWKKRKPDEHLVETILQAVQRAKTSEEWKNEGGKYIPYPASWLNAAGWADELTVQTTAKAKEFPR